MGKQRAVDSATTWTTAENWLKALFGVIGLVLVVALPVMAATLVVGYLIADRRLVRERWWLLWTAVTGAAAIAVAGGPIDWLVGGVRAAVSWPVRVWHGLAPVWAGGGIPDSWLDAVGLWNWQQIITHQVLFGVPAGLALTAVYNLARMDPRRRAGRIDDPDYSNVRPVGVLDRWRARRNLAKVADGAYSRPTGGGGVSALGVGMYGRAVTIARSTLKKAAIILGGPRTGKTRMAKSLASQEVRAGAGLIAIDYKGDPTFVSHYAALAAEMGRGFLHFQLFGKSLGVYHQPHPYAPEGPAFYDPLVRGNGASKAEMLLNSAPRNGDAAAYLRTALEVVQVAYDVANLTGFDRGRGGFEVIEQMLSLEFLSTEAEKITPEMVRRQFPAMSMQQAVERAARIRGRVEQQVVEARRNPVLKGAIQDSQTWTSYFASSPAIGGMMRPGPPANTIDLVRAILRSEIVVFSLPVMDYPELAAAIGNMILLDLTAAVSTLRTNKSLVSELTGVDASAADATPWPPAVVQIEEFGSANNEVVLGLLNKSSAEGLRVLMSTQAWADLQAVDDTGVWARRVLEQVDNLFAFSGVESEGDRMVSDTSGRVRKVRPRENIQVRKANIIGLFRGARRASDTTTTSEEEPRIDYGTVQALRPPPAFEFLWLSKSPRLTAVHTIPEGPNRWFERLTFTGVHELPLGWSVEGNMSADEIAEYAAAGEKVRADLTEDITTNPVLNAVLTAGYSQDGAQTHPAAPRPSGTHWPAQPQPAPEQQSPARPAAPPARRADHAPAPTGPTQSPPLPTTGLRRRSAATPGADPAVSHRGTSATSAPPRTADATTVSMTRPPAAPAAPTPPPQQEPQAASPDIEQAAPAKADERRRDSLGFDPDEPITFDL